ncbi:prolow-density lipoprotein receptor-related protein 1 isoform X2 [Lingula anatina]|uniref:Prolow-density lipoprotein receptor-related protein 1 isoform X2 n=1 Tax=Lingula anatina TaxID=7574 RepID=A0A1S3IDI0_LINAN|nr:prolow-density lipoprotein receptor-related protein 1 isoform X2 [Lingula anatina]|eukprot:XP_013396320.1 prolow-density lipoprotein receptor-related protein 1 isoform X2 [Lingula anatina]
MDATVWILPLTLFLGTIAGYSDKYSRDNFLLFSDHSNIYQISLSAPSQVPQLLLSADKTRYPSAIDYDPIEETVYWIDSVSHVIWKSFINGTVETKVADLDETSVPMGIAVDYVSKLIYYTDAGEPSINVIRMNDSLRLVIVDQGVKRPTSIIIDPFDLNLYWIDEGLRQVMRSDMSGAKIEAVVSQNVAEPRGLALDLKGRRLYWSDAGSNTINALNLKDNNVQMIYNETNRNPGYQDIALKGNSTLYYTASVERSPVQISFPGSIRDKVGSQTFSNLRGIVAYESSSNWLQIYGNRGTARCSVNNGGCEDLCFPVKNQEGRVCNCTGSKRLLADGKSCSDVTALHGSNILFLQNLDSLAIAYIGGIPGEPIAWVRSDDRPLSFWRIRSRGRRLTAIDFDYARESVYVADTETKTIRGLALNGSAIQTYTIYSGISTNAGGVAVDWINKNIYWTDAEYHVVMMAKCERSSKYVRTIATEGLDKPHSIAVHPARGYVFWIDYGEFNKLERSELDGKNRMIIAQGFVGTPKALTVDFQNDKVYWADILSSGTLTSSVIYHSDLDGKNKVEFKTSTYSSIQSMVFFKGMLFTSDHDKLPLMGVYNATDAESMVIRIGGAGPVTGVTVYHKDRQAMPNVPNPCLSKNCDQLCVVTPKNLARCTCSNGYTFDTDSSKCVGSEIKSGFMYSLGDRLCQPHFNVTSSTVNTPYDYCFLKQSVPGDVDVTEIYRIAVNKYSQEVFYYSSKKRLMRTMLTNTSDVTSLIYGIDSLGGLALDWLSDNLYWTEVTNGQIWAAKTDGTLQKILLKNLSSPRDIIVHPLRGSMYWISKNKIQTADLDGQNKRNLMNISISPTCLTFDYIEERLYWFDSKDKDIRSVGILGEDQRIITLPKNFNNITSIAVYKGILAYTDITNQTGLHLLNISNSNSPIAQNVTTLLHRDHTDAYDVIVVDRSYQQLTQAPCDSKSQHGCEQLCFPKPSGKVCGCIDGMKLQADGKTCESAKIMEDNFFLIADDYRHSIFQADVDFKTLSALKLPTNYEWPMGIDYDPTEKRVYWSDWKKGIIRSMHLNGTGVITLRQGKPGSRVDGVAIDTSSKNLYFTDRGLDTLGVIKRDGSIPETTIYSSNSRSFNPRAILLNPGKGTFYYTLTTPNSSPSVMNATMGGTNHTKMVSHGLRNPNGLTADFEAQKLYWVDGYEDRVEEYNLATGERTTLKVLSSSHGFAITRKGDYLYWTDWLQKGIFRMDRRNGTASGKVDVFHYDYFTGLNGLKYYNTSVKRETTACSQNNGGCAVYCLPMPGNKRKCACPDGETLHFNGRDCAKGLMCPDMKFTGGVFLDGCMGETNQTCNYTCEKGFRPSVDSSTARCNPQTGQFEPDLSTLCIVERCPLLVLPVGTLGRCQGRNRKNICQVDCIPGYRKTSGSGVFTCLDDLTWDGSITCEQLHCSGDITNGNIARECNTTAGSSCEYVCNPGYQKTTSKVHCNITGIWEQDLTTICNATIFVPTTPTTTTTTTTTATTTMVNPTPSLLPASTTSEAGVIGPKASSQGQDDNKGLIAGIVVVVVVLIVLIVILAVILVRRRNRSPQYVDQTNMSDSESIRGGSTSGDVSVGVKVGADGSLAIVNPAFGEPGKPEMMSDTAMDDVFLGMKDEKGLIVNNHDTYA